MKSNAFVIVLLSLALNVVAATGESAKRKQEEPAQGGRGGVLPLDENGKPINTDFETGDLRDWTQISGNAFNGQPIKGDTVHARRGDSHSRHAGNFWVGTFEINQDGPRGIIQSRAFKVNHPF